MANSDRVDVWPCVSAFRPNLKHLWVLLAGVFCAASAPSKAAPITLAFEATIGTVFTGIPFDSGIDFHMGDVVSGRITFDPLPGDGSHIVRVLQPHPFTLYIGGNFFSSPNIEIESINDADAVEFPIAGLIDVLNTGGSGLSPANPAAFPKLSPQHCDFVIWLNGPGSVLAMASVPADVTDWNEFNLWRQMVVSFGDGKGGVMGFQATLGQFVVIPEPEPLVLMALGLVFVTILTRR